MKSESYIVPDWPSPDNVKSVITTRHGGVSRGNFAGFNLADHVGDEESAVIQNREKLVSDLRLPREPFWLQQVHGIRVLNADASGMDRAADGSVAFQPGLVCSVMTADCLPVLLCDTQGSRVAALHAGWRGLAAGILEQGVESLQCNPRDLIAYLGPAIGPGVFEVGAEVRHAFVGKNPAAGSAFCSGDDNKWLADIYLLAIQRLAAAGVEKVYGGGRCTYSEPDDFFSFRRDKTCGRMAALIWMDSTAG